MSALSWHIWCALAVVLMILEAVTPGFFTACLAVGSLAASVAALLNFEPKIQIYVFVVISLFMGYAIRPIMNKYLSMGKLKTNADALVGKQGVSVGGGYIDLDGMKWKIDGESIPKGVKVTVISVGGATVKVKPIEK